MSSGPGRATVAHVNGSVVRTTSGGSRSWRMRQWPNDVSVAHLIFVDHRALPTADAVEAAVEHARRKGARAVRTSAMFPSAAAVVLDSGFAPIDELALLQLDLRDDVAEAWPPSRHKIRSLAPWMHPRAAELDRAAFGPMWGNDAASLRDVQRATPISHARAVRIDRRLAGFSIAGAAADSGYLQRLAVDPDRQRGGIARDLVVDALRWMRRIDRSRCLVNTGLDNQGALALYEGIGFRRLDDVLTIAERRL